MSAERKDVEPIFNAALEKGTTAERAAFLEGACGDDADLRARVEALLKAHAEADQFLEAPAVDANATAELPASGRPLTEGPGTIIDRYKLLQLIGEGGFGLVYMAEQQEPVRRKVALKIIKLGMDTKQVIARFEAERQALALMEHPNIAKVLDAGATETGRPYFVMELVKGIPITEYCDRNKLSTHERLELFTQVCHAIQHAHQKGIIHRDIKPNNVLVTLHDSVPVPKVIDFGIAKATSQRLTEKTLFTGFRQFIGTPEYMSPDQAEISGLDVDTRTDIYSLGVMLYELLTGTTPFDATTLRNASYEEIQRIIREVEPPKPSTRVATLAAEGTDTTRHRRAEPIALHKLIRGDLDWIVMKAMEKDRTRRYDTAADLANDIRRHLHNEPVLAGPPSTVYKLSKFIRRHRVGVLAGSVAVAALLVGLSLATVGLIQANSARTALEAERDAAEVARLAAVEARQSEEEHRRFAEDNAKTAQQEATKSTAVAQFMHELLASVDPGRALGRGVTVRYVLDEAVQELNQGSLAEQPEVEAAVRMTIGETYRALGLYGAAEEHFQVAETTFRGMLGDEDPETLRAGSLRGAVIRLQGRYAEAESILRRTLATQRSVQGDDHPDTLTTADRLGVALWRQGRYRDAERIHRRTLEAQRHVLGPEHPDTVNSMSNLGAVLWHRGKLATAEKIEREALAIARRTLGEEHPQSLRLMNNLALVVSDRGDYAAAEELSRQTFEIDRRILGDEHPDTWRSLNNLGRLLLRQGKSAEAEMLHRRELEVERRAIGEDHPETSRSLGNLIEALKAQGKRDQMRGYVRQQLAQRRRAAERPGADASALNSYAWMLLTCEFADLQDPAKALPIAQRAVELSDGRDPLLLDTLAAAYHRTGDLARAIETQKRAVALPGATPEIRTRLIGLLWEKGDYLRTGEQYFGGLVKHLATPPDADSTAAEPEPAEN